MTFQQRAMIECTIQEVTAYLIEDNGISLIQAMDQFFLSDTFEKLNEPETGLYLEGSAYVYELFKREHPSPPDLKS